jgi:hypothetical protein
MDGITTSVKTLIDQFELMATANAATTAPAAPRSWSISRSEKTTLSAAQPKSDNSPMKNTEEANEAAEPAEEQPSEEEAQVAKPTTPIKYKTLTVKTAESDDDDDTKTCNSCEDESDADSTTTTKSTCYSTVPASPSSYSTASTGSLDSLLSSLDMFLPELLQASGETSAEISKIAKRTVYRSRRSSLPESLQTTTTSKLVPPTSYRRASLTGQPSSLTTKKEVAPTAAKSRRSSLYAQKNLTAATPARPRCSSLSATMVPPPSAKSTRRFSESARGAPPVVTSPRARSRSGSSSLPRYMDYDSSPRFAATKAKNMERRRQLEERNRNLAADKAKPKTARKPRTPEWQGRLDQVRSRLFDAKDDASSHASKTKATTTTSRRRSTSNHARV